MTRKIRLTVNGQDHEVTVEDSEILVDVIRHRLGLTGTKKSCETGECGCCTVILDGCAVNSCLILAVEADGSSIMTVEGLGQNGELHPLQEAFIKMGAIQCGFCTPGMLMATKALLDRNPMPSEDEVRRAITGNLCRCTGYVKIVAAVLQAAQRLHLNGPFEHTDKRVGRMFSE